MSNTKNRVNKVNKWDKWWMEWADLECQDVPCLKCKWWCRIQWCKWWCKWWCKEEWVTWCNNSVEVKTETRWEEETNINITKDTRIKDNNTEDKEEDNTTNKCKDKIDKGHNKGNNTKIKIKCKTTN